VQIYTPTTQLGEGGQVKPIVRSSPTARESSRVRLGRCGRLLHASSFARAGDRREGRPQGGRAAADIAEQSIAMLCDAVLC
jgi:hypothetical protein